MENYRTSRRKILLFHKKIQNKHSKRKKIEAITEEFTLLTIQGTGLYRISKFLESILKS